MALEVKPETPQMGQGGKNWCYTHEEKDCLLGHAACLVCVLGMVTLDSESVEP